MRRFATPSLRHRRALWLSIALTSFATVGHVLAQVPGTHPDPSALQAWQLDEGLQRELERARSEVAQAREAAMAAKSELEAAVTARETTPQNQTSNSASPSHVQATDAVLEDANVAGVKVLKRLIAELQAERMELLAHLTLEHPLIRDADMKLEEYHRQLAGLTSDSSGAQTAISNDGKLRIVVEEQRTAEITPAPQSDAPAAEATQPNAEDSLRLEQAMSKWETAQTDLEAAMDRESATADRIASLLARQAESQRKAEQQVHPKPADDVTALATPVQSPSNTATSAPQPLVLAAFVIALLIAAVASIKLARATDQSIFSGADDAAAALSLPVMGVIPAGSAAAAHGSLLHRHRTATFVIQVLAAVAVFALVAFMVQNPGAIWQFVSAPLNSWQ